ncbi:hypothetical protein [Nocardioides sp. GY 10127]|uniref:hypothetical protein n=1 Tax=Nocardioides sp. GY 10127 TaxID=2569762 RepID=UPI0010A90750|nr:hypothetical protein [Nocardioides sp. GY 10127]TIC85425.1 hypothetical protein E8D37_01935 [Nocardioides sp. GY 10127]
MPDPSPRPPTPHDLTGPGGGLPVDPAADTLVALRRAVVDLASGEARRRFPALVHVGVPGGRQRLLPAADDGLDRTLRVEVLSGLLALSWQEDAGRRPLVWLTRPGPVDPVQDVDVEWLGATCQAAREIGTGVVFVVVDRHGWRDPRSGAHQRWRRVRPVR